MTRVLVVDDHDLVRRDLVAVVSNCGLEVHEAGSGAEALQQLADRGGPWIILLDWIIPQPDGFGVCRFVREHFKSTPPYVILTSGRATRADVAQGIRSGADEFLAKPIAPDVLKDRLLVARRRVADERPPSRIVLDGLREGVNFGSGELLVRDGEWVARVLFHRGKLVWVSISDDSDSFAAALREDGVSLEEVHAAAAEARQTGRGFHTILTDWGVLTQERLKEVTKGWIQRRLITVLSCQRPQVLFVPNQLGGGEHTVSFELEDVISPSSAARAPSIVPGSMPPPGTEDSNWLSAFHHPPEPDPEAQDYLKRVMAIEGTRSCAVINWETAHCEAWLGAPMDPGLVWANLSAISASAVGGNAVEELYLATAEDHHFLRVIDQARRRVGYAVIDRRSGSFGMVRAAFSRALRNENLLPDKSSD